MLFRLLFDEISGQFALLWLISRLCLGHLMKLTNVMWLLDEISGCFVNFWRNLRFFDEISRYFAFSDVIWGCSVIFNILAVVPQSSDKIFGSLAIFWLKVTVFLWSFVNENAFILRFFDKICFHFVIFSCNLRFFRELLT